jgi:hypothetical protein
MAKITQVKALNNFYSQEFGHVSIGDELSIGSQSTLDDLTNAGHVEEIGYKQEGSVSATQNEDMQNYANSMPNAQAMNSEFAAESHVSANDVHAAQKNMLNAHDTEFAADSSMNAASMQANAKANAMNSEFAAESHVDAAEMSAPKKAAKKSANKMSDSE